MSKLIIKIAFVLLSVGGGLATIQSQESSNAPATPGDARQRPIRVRVSQKVSEAFISRKVQPQYPQEAREKQIQGLVVLKAEISKEGDVTELMLVSGHPLLAPAAIEAVKQWKYKPYQLNGQPVAVETQVSVSFELRQK